MVAATGTKALRDDLLNEVERLVGGKGLPERLMEMAGSAFYALKVAEWVRAALVALEGEEAVDPRATLLIFLKGCVESRNGSGPVLDDSASLLGLPLPSIFVERVGEVVLPYYQVPRFLEIALTALTEGKFELEE